MRAWNDTTPVFLQTGTVYFIAPVEGGPIKIGWSGQVANRFVCLQGWSWMDLKIIASAPGRQVDERAIQNLFVKDNVRGEWFRPSAGLLTLIEEISTTGVLPERCIGHRKTPVLIRHGKPRKPWSDDAKAAASAMHKIRWEQRRAKAEKEARRIKREARKARANSKAMAA